jgi:Domain of unknown function (DUF4832)/Domain of unknown function (DUF4874)
MNPQNIWRTACMVLATVAIVACGGSSNSNSTPTSVASGNPTPGASAPGTSASTPSTGASTPSAGASNPSPGTSVPGGGGTTPPAVATVTATYTENTVNYTNPERGWSRWLTDDFVKVVAADAKALYDAQITMGYAIVRLDAFKDKAIPSAYLTQLQTAFDTVRANGVKVVLRFAYNYPSGTVLTTDTDAPLSIVQQHIAQLKPLLEKNADVIAVWQAGFIGLWGEGHTSSNGLTTADNKLKVRDALLAAAPAGRMLQWRYPPDLMAWTPTAPGEADAFGPGVSAKIGLYNDCFMSSPDDVGTYSDVAAEAAPQREYMKKASAITPFGGETCDAQANQTRKTCSSILSEGKDYHLSFLGRDYYTAFHDQWKAEGCFAEMERSMGYRYVIDAAQTPVSGAPGADSSFQVTLRNVGWSRLFNARPLLLTLRHRSTGEEIQMQTATDVRSLLPGAAAKTFSFTTKPATTAASGMYDVYLSLPDGAATLAKDTRFAVRFANADDAAKAQAWDASTARFKLGTTFEVK